MITSFLVIFFFVADILRPTKKILSQKKNYSPTNEVTHPTETPICLWYDVFMPPTPLRPPNEKIPKVPQSLTGAPLKKYTTLLRDFSHICLWYNIFMPPHPPNISVNFLKIPHKMRPYQAIFNWSIFNFFFLPNSNRIFFYHFGLFFHFEILKSRFLK